MCKELTTTIKYLLCGHHTTLEETTWEHNPRCRTRDFKAQTKHFSRRAYCAECRRRLMDAKVDGGEEEEEYYVYYKKEGWGC